MSLFLRHRLLQFAGPTENERNGRQRQDRKGNRQLCAGGDVRAAARGPECRRTRRPLRAGQKLTFRFVVKALGVNLMPIREPGNIAPPSV